MNDRGVTMIIIGYATLCRDLATVKVPKDSEYKVTKPVWQILVDERAGMKSLDSTTRRVLSWSQLAEGLFVWKQWLESQYNI